MIQVPLPEVHDKTTKIIGLTLQQPFLQQIVTEPESGILTFTDVPPPYLMVVVCLVLA